MNTLAKVQILAQVNFSLFGAVGFCPYLWIDVQDADLAGVHHLVDGVDLGAVQVPVVLAVLQETAVLDVCLHLTTCHEQVHLPILLVYFGFPAGD